MDSTHHSGNDTGFPNIQIDDGQESVGRSTSTQAPTTRKKKGTDPTVIFAAIGGVAVLLLGVIMAWALLRDKSPAHDPNVAAATTENENSENTESDEAASQQKKKSLVQLVAVTKTPQAEETIEATRPERRAPVEKPTAQKEKEPAIELPTVATGAPAAGVEIAQANTNAEAKLTAAKASIQSRQIDAAIGQLKEYLAMPGTANRADAQRLLNDAQLANSNDRVIAYIMQELSKVQLSAQQKSQAQAGTIAINWAHKTVGAVMYVNPQNPNVVSTVPPGNPVIVLKFPMQGPVLDEMFQVRMQYQIQTAVDRFSKGAAAPVVKDAPISQIPDVAEGGSTLPTPTKATDPIAPIAPDPNAPISKVAPGAGGDPVDVPEPAKAGPVPTDPAELMEYHDLSRVKTLWVHKNEATVDEMRLKTKTLAGEYVKAKKEFSRLDHAWLAEAKKRLAVAEKKIGDIYRAGGAFVGVLEGLQQEVKERKAKIKIAQDKTSEVETRMEKAKADLKETAKKGLALIHKTGEIYGRLEADSAVQRAMNKLGGKMGPTRSLLKAKKHFERINEQYSGLDFGGR